jgi:putative membrane protein
MAMIATIPGFLGTRASLMLDVVFLAMFAVLPVMGYSIYLVKYRGRFALHKTIQLVLGGVLLLTVTLFEADMRINGWEQLAEGSPYFNGDEWSGVWISLYIHLVFAITTAFLWIYVIVQALRRFPKPPAPGQHSPQHIVLARIAALDMVATAVTGWTFYWIAFVAA